MVNGTSIDAVDPLWYASTYPHVIAEAERLGMASLDDHHRVVGAAAGLHPHPFGLRRDGRNAALTPDTAVRHLLFPRNIFGFITQGGEPYLRRHQTAALAAALATAMVEAWRRDGGRHGYFEIALAVSGGEPHHILHAALARCQAGDHRRARALLAGLDDIDGLGQYHALLLAIIANTLGDRDRHAAAAATYERLAPARAWFALDAPPPVLPAPSPKPDDVRTALLGLSFSLFSLFTRESRCEIHIAGRSIGAALGEPRPSIHEAIGHLGGANPLASTRFSFLSPLTIADTASSPIPVDIINHVTLFDGTERVHTRRITLESLGGKSLGSRPSGRR